jgi:electron transfer flavoprotein alpha subunit
MTVWIETERCDGCRRCLKACPYGALELKDDKAQILERCTSCGACIEVCRQSAILSDAVPREIPDFSDRQGVWVFAEQREGVLMRVSFELLGIARELAAQLDQSVSAVLLGGAIVPNLAEELIAHGADTVYRLEHPLLTTYRSEPYTDALESIIREEKPDTFLIGATHMGRDLAPRIAHRVGVGLTADCTQLTIDSEEKILLQTRPAFGGNVMATIANRFSRPQMATVRPGVMRAKRIQGHRGRIVPVEVVLDESRIHTRVLDVIKEKTKLCDLSQAKIIVAGGRGVGGHKGFRLLQEMAELMNAEMAGTRVAVEEGWISADNQVGQTGQTVRPEIYFALGISGAIQHRAGMMNSRYIVAVNRDSRAPIFKVANWGIVGNVFDILPEMIQQLRTAATRSSGNR